MNVVFIAAGGLMTASGVSISFGSIMRVFTRAGAYAPGRTASRNRDMNALRNVGDVLVMCGVLFLLYGAFPFFRAHVLLAGFLSWLVAAVSDICSIIVSRERLLVKAEPAGEIRNHLVKTSLTPVPLEEEPWNIPFPEGRKMPYRGGERRTKTLSNRKKY